MSSFISESERLQAAELGVDAMLDKPFRLSELLAMLARVTGDTSIGVSG
jgi:DNA-binding response OmpR family regulator